MKRELDQQGITKRVLELVAEAMCTNAMFAKLIEIDPGNFHKKLIGTQKWTINDVKKICSSRNISKEWLIEGIGNKEPNDNYTPKMAELPSEIPSGIVSNTQIDTAKKRTKPRIPNNVVMAGHLSDYIDGVKGIDCEQAPIVQQFPTYDFTIFIKGNSMEPKFEGGDEIACKRVYDVIEWGETYVLDTDDGAIVKRIYDAGDKIRCASYNSEYHDFFIEKDKVRKIFKIVGLLRI